MAVLYSWLFFSETKMVANFKQIYSTCMHSVCHNFSGNPVRRYGNNKITVINFDALMHFTHVLRKFHSTKHGATVGEAFSNLHGHLTMVSTVATIPNKSVTIQKHLIGTYKKKQYICV